MSEKSSKYKQSESAFFDIDLDPARKENETYEEYVQRRKQVNKRIRLHLKGKFRR